MSCWKWLFSTLLNSTNSLTPITSLGAMTLPETLLVSRNLHKHYSLLSQPDGSPSTVRSSSATLPSARLTLGTEPRDLGHQIFNCYWEAQLSSEASMVSLPQGKYTEKTCSESSAIFILVSCLPFLTSIENHFISCFWAWERNHIISRYLNGKILAAHSS